MSGARELTTSGGADSATRVEAVGVLAHHDPTATLLCFDADGRGMAAPPHLAIQFDSVDTVEHLSDLRLSVGHTSLREPADLGPADVRWAQAYPPASPETAHRAILVDLLDVAGLACVCAVVSSRPVGERMSRGDAQFQHDRRGEVRLDATSKVLDADDGAVEMLGLSREELIGFSTLEYMHPDDHDLAVVQWLHLVEEPGATTRQLLRYRDGDGGWFWAEVVQRNTLDELGYIERHLIDVDTKIQAVVQAQSANRIIEGLTHVLPSGIAVFDEDDNAILCNVRWHELMGTSGLLRRDEFVSYIVDPPLPELTAASVAAIAANGQYDGLVTVEPADGGPQRRCRLALRLLGDGEDYRGLVACLDDITDSWLLQQRLAEQASTDSLTGLINRKTMIGCIDAALGEARGRDDLTAVLFIDLNDFKRVNDTLGHAVGDQLLSHVASTLGSTVRSSDLVSRHGGDEFLVLCRQVDNAASVMTLARRLLDAVTGRFIIDGKPVDTGASIGVAIDKGGQHSAERMIAQADLAMYETKRARAHDVGIFEPAMFTDQRLELDRDAALRQATTDGSLVLHYQPIVELATGRTIGYEALIRWMFEGELVLPDGFIGLAERRGIISEIGEWVVEQVISTASADPRRDLLWTLNVSPMQLRQGALEDVVLRALDHHGLAPAQLGLELTETATLARTEKLVERLRTVTERGVSLIVDDFGTGFASLDYVRTMPVNGLKVDRSFTSELHLERTRAIVANVINLAEMLDVRLVIEGVETAEQRDALLEMGAKHAQGYFFGRPAPDPTG